MKQNLILLTFCAILIYVRVEEMEKQGIVPDVIDVVPPKEASVKYPGNNEAKMGNVLTPTQVKDMPMVKWDADSSALYTLAMVDPDAPSRENPKFREWHHWLVVNIPGDNISAGETLSEYIGAGPPEGTNLHRYVFLIYKQNGRIQCDEPKLKNNSGKNRGKFRIQKFADKYKLGKPVAGNFFCAKYDNYVPKLYKQLGN